MNHCLLWIFEYIYFSFLFWERTKLILKMFRRRKSRWMWFLNTMKHCSCWSLNSYLKKKKKEKDVRRIVCQEIVGSVCTGARKGSPASSFCLWRVSYCPEGALALCAAVSLPGLACSGLEWIKQAVGKVPLICIPSRQPCRTLCWQEITVFVTFSQGPLFGRDGPCDHASSQQQVWLRIQWHVFLSVSINGVEESVGNDYTRFGEKIINTWRTNATIYGIMLQIEVNIITKLVKTISHNVTV